MRLVCGALVFGIVMLTLVASTIGQGKGQTKIAVFVKDADKARINGATVIVTSSSGTTTGTTRGPLASVSLWVADDPGFLVKAIKHGYQTYEEYRTDCDGMGGSGCVIELQR